MWEFNMSKKQKEAAFKVFESYDFLKLYNDGTLRSTLCKTIDTINGDTDAHGNSTAHYYWVEYKNQHVDKIRDEAYRLANIGHFMEANKLYNSLLDDQKFKITFSGKTPE